MGAQGPLKWLPLGTLGAAGAPTVTEYVRVEALEVLQSRYLRVREPWCVPRPPCPCMAALRRHSDSAAPCSQTPVARVPVPASPPLVLFFILSARMFLV